MPMHFILFVILATSHGQICTDLEYPLIIQTSPGFLSGAISHVSNQECSDSGICYKTPIICPNTSCCLSIPNKFPGNISVPASLSKSKCGCWDYRRKSCNAISNFHITYYICNFKENEVQIQSHIQIVRGSGDADSKVCKENRAEVTLDVVNGGLDVLLKIKTVTCVQQSRKKDQNPVDDSLSLIEETVPIARNITDSTGLRETLRTFRSQKYQTLTNKTYSPTQDDDFGRWVPSICGNVTKNDFVLISSNFLPGSINNIFQLNTEDNNRIYKVLSTVCTETGKRVQRSLSVRIPSNGLNPCVSDSQSWEKAEFMIEINENGNLEAIVEVRKCILSGENQEFLEIEETAKVELNTEIVYKLLELFE